MKQHELTCCLFLCLKEIGYRMKASDNSHIKASESHLVSFHPILSSILELRKSSFICYSSLGCNLRHYLQLLDWSQAQHPWVHPSYWPNCPCSHSMTNHLSWYKRMYTCDLPFCWNGSFSFPPRKNLIACHTKSERNPNYSQMIHTHLCPHQGLLLLSMQGTIFCPLSHCHVYFWRLKFSVLVDSGSTVVCPNHFPHKKSELWDLCGQAGRNIFTSVQARKISQQIFFLDPASSQCPQPENQKTILSLNCKSNIQTRRISLFRDWAPTQRWH